MSKPIAYLFKSNKPTKKWAMFFPASVKLVHFGGAGYRDFTLVSDPKSVHYIKDRKEREAVKKAYESRHAGDRLTDPESPGSMSMTVLWSAPTLKKGIRNYSRKYSINLVDKTDETYSKEAISKLI